MKITSENASDCAIRIADDMNYGWGAFKKGGGGQFKACAREGEKEQKNEAEVPSTSQENTDSCEIQGWSPL